MEQQEADAKEQARRIHTIRYLIIPVSLLLLVVPLVFWGRDEDLSLRVIMLLGNASSYLMALIACMQSWRSTSRWHTLNRVLLLLSALIAAGALLHGPAELVGGGMGFGVISGSALSLTTKFAAACGV